MTDFKKGDRVKVTDLRTGITHPAVVVDPPPANSNYMNVRYDDDPVTLLRRVGKGFVSAA